MDVTDLPNITADALLPISPDGLVGEGDDGHPPRILLLYGSLRATSYSRAAA